MSNFTLHQSGSPIPWLKRLDAEFSGSGSRIVKSMAVAAGKTVRTHFRQLDQQRHRGFSSRNFYGGAAGATNEEVSGNDIVVVVGDGNVPGNSVALRYFGKADGLTTNKRFLTIPVADEAQGKRMREFGDDLKIIFNRRTGKGVALLANRVLYALTKKTKPIQPDPTVLPTASDLSAAMATAAQEVVDRIKEGR